MIEEILGEVSSVSEFRFRLLEVMKRREESLSDLVASLDACSLLSKLDDLCLYGSSMKFVMYPNGSGVDLFIGDDVEVLSEKFGWKWRELRNV